MTPPPTSTPIPPNQTCETEKRWRLHLPEGYQKIPLPGLTAWLQALRSGDYRQGTGSLYSNGKYCCLGVLVKIQGLLGSGEHASFGSLNASNPLFPVLGHIGAFPPTVRVEYLPDPGSLMDHSGSAKTLVTLNDSAGFTFPEIADILEALYIEPEPKPAPAA